MNTQSRTLIDLTLTINENLTNYPNTNDDALVNIGIDKEYVK